jgi:serine/threonine-protein kinase
LYPQIFGKYVLEGELARGGMARLMLATLRGAGGFEKRLVVKQIRDELASDETFVKRFVDEAKTTVSLSHPNIVPVYELGVEQGTYFLAMELVEGVSIAELLDDGVLSPEHGAYVGAEVCRALDYAHRRMQVVHRDITPRNVMVDEEGQVKLIDFGIAALVRGQNIKQQVFGSPGHMAPEQMEGKPVGPPADLFALGALLMEGWSKKAPFRRKTPDEVDAALRGPRTKPSVIDARLLPLDDVMLRALASEASERPQSAEDFGRSLRKFLSGLDSDDLRRELGARVKKRRAAIRAKKDAPPESAKGGLQRPASRGEMITKTFAARQEVKTWSERPGPTQEETGPSTRKIGSEPPQKSDQRIETIATRPLETPTSPKTISTRSSARTIGVVALVGIALAGAYFVRQRHTVQSSAASDSTSHATATAYNTTATTTTTAPLATSSPTQVGTVAPVASSAEIHVAAHLALYGDPGTRAIVDGVAKGNCPVADVSVEPGDHDVRFVFDVTGDTTGTRVTVKANERVKLRADFTGATPTVRIQR